MITPQELATLKSFWSAEDERNGGQSDCSRCIAEIERLLITEEAARAILPYLGASNDPPQAVNAIFIHPAEALRRSADHIDRRDSAITTLRKSLSPSQQ